MPALITAVLQDRWREHYQIDWDPARKLYKAVRRDDTATVFEHAEPEELWQMLYTDHRDRQAAAPEEPPPCSWPSSPRS